MVCQKCGGHGRRPLPPTLQQTLDALRAYSTATATGLRERLPGVNVPAICNRLAELERTGHAASHVDGRERWYRAVRR
jgi:hypothetical protein